MFGLFLYQLFVSIMIAVGLLLSVLLLLCTLELSIWQFAKCTFCSLHFWNELKKLPTDSQNTHNVTFYSVSGELAVAIGSSQLAFFELKEAARKFYVVNP